MKKPLTYRELAGILIELNKEQLDSHVTVVLPTDEHFECTFELANHANDVVDYKHPLLKVVA